MPGAYGIDEFHKKLEDFLFSRYRARPHWSKNNFLSYNRVERLYPHLDRWRRVYTLFNARGTFDNEFTRKCGFDDFHLREDSAAGRSLGSDGAGAPEDGGGSPGEARCGARGRTCRCSAGSGELDL